MREATGKRCVIEGQWATKEIGDHADDIWHIADLLPGISLMVAWDGGELSFSGVRPGAIIPKRLLMEMEASLLPEEFAWKFNDERVALWVQGYGPGVSNSKGYRQIELCVNDVWVAGGWLNDLTTTDSEVGLLVNRPTVGSLARMVSYAKTPGGSSLGQTASLTVTERVLRVKLRGSDFPGEEQLPFGYMG